MKCPYCQHDNYDGAKFCLQCGAPMPKPPSKAKTFFIALLKALAYYALFYGVQSVVIVVYEFVLILGEA